MIHESISSTILGICLEKKTKEKKVIVLPGYGGEAFKTKKWLLRGQLNPGQGWFTIHVSDMESQVVYAYGACARDSAQKWSFTSKHSHSV